MMNDFKASSHKPTTFKTSLIFILKDLSLFRKPVMKLVSGLKKSEAIELLRSLDKNQPVINEYSDKQLVNVEVHPKFQNLSVNIDKGVYNAYKDFGIQQEYQNPLPLNLSLITKKSAGKRYPLTKNDVYSALNNDLKKDVDILLLAGDAFGIRLQFLLELYVRGDSNLKNNMDYARLLLQKSTAENVFDTYTLLSQPIRSAPSVFLNSIEKCSYKKLPLLLNSMPKELLSDKTTVLTLVWLLKKIENCEGIFTIYELLDDELAMDKEIIFSLVSFGFIHHINHKYFNLEGLVRDNEKKGRLRETYSKNNNDLYNLFFSLPEKLKTDIDIVKILIYSSKNVSEKQRIYGGLSKKLYTNPVLVNYLLGSVYSSEILTIYEGLPESVTQNDEIVKTVLKNCPDNDLLKLYMLFSDDLKRHTDILSDIIKRFPDGCVLYKAMPETIQKQESYLRKFLTNSKLYHYDDLFRILHPELKCRKDILIQFADTTRFKNKELFYGEIFQAFTDDEAFILELLKRDIYAPKYIPVDYRNNIDFCLKIIKQTSHAGYYYNTFFSDQMKNNRDIVLAMLNTWGVFPAETLDLLNFYRNLGADLKNDREVVIACIRIGGEATANELFTHYLSDELKNDEEINRILHIKKNTVKKSGNAMHLKPGILIKPPHESF